MSKKQSAVSMAAFVAALGALPAAALHGQLASSAPIADEFDRLHFRSIGPAVNSGRISALAVYEANPSIYYVGSAHGGVWKTTSNGFTFTPLLQDKGLLSIGAVAVSQRNPNVVYVGTGEANNRQSTSWGDGLYKSTDGGATFTHIGLASSKHISRIVIDPRNDDAVLVAAVGPLFGPGGERGIYKTTDGGGSWRQVLKGDDDTGANDLVMAYDNPQLLYASTYQRRRTTCCMNGGGPGSAVWKSTDGGETWNRVGGGLPSGSLGRIGLDIYRQNSSIVYALIEGGGAGEFVAGAGRGGAGVAQAGDTAGASARGGRGRGAADPATGVYRSDDGGTTWRKMSSVNPRPMYFSQIRIEPSNPDRLFMGGVGLHMSIDAGKTFETNSDQVIHSDHHAIWLDPRSPGHMLVGNDGGLAVSYDTSKTWAFLPNLPVGLFYHVGFDMETPFNVCGGMQDNYVWCGPSVSRHTHGIMNYDWIEIEGGDGFVAVPDLRDSRIVYSEAQDGNMIRRNKVTGEGKSIRPGAGNVTPAPAKGETYRFNWDTPLMFSPNDPGVLLTAANKVFKSTDRGDSWTVISPDLTTNANRDTIVTMGLRNSETFISRNDGVSAWPTIVALAESPKQPGVFYTGTDDGVVSVSRDGGRTWQNVTRNIPGFPGGFAYVSRVTPSRFSAGRVYVTVDNHRQNDYEPYIWMSDDFGVTFKSITAGLRGENVHVITEDQKNPDVLYIGTESGIFLSLDRGQSWRRFKANFPNVRVDEITLHPRDNAMLVASHGRDLWILDHLAPIQEYNAATTAAGDARLFTIPTALEWKTMDNRNDEFWGHQYFVGENPPIDAMIQFHLKRPLGDPQLRISDASGKVVRRLVLPANRNQPGIQTVCWDMRTEPNPVDSAAAQQQAQQQARPATPPVPGIPLPAPSVGYLPVNPCGEDAGVGTASFGVGGPAHLGAYVMPGTYTVTLVGDGKTLDTKPLRIMMDPAVKLADTDRRRYDALVNELHEAQRVGMQAAAALTKLYPQMTGAAAKLRAANAPSAVADNLAALNKQFDAVRVKFGVPAAPAGRGGGGGGGGGRGGPDTQNALAQLNALKVGVLAIWEAPTPALVRQSGAASLAVQQAVREANAFLAAAQAMAPALKQYDVILTAAPPVK